MSHCSNEMESNTVCCELFIKIGKLNLISRLMYVILVRDVGLIIWYLITNEENLLDVEWYD